MGETAKRYFPKNARELRWKVIKMRHSWENHETIQKCSGKSKHHRHHVLKSVACPNANYFSKKNAKKFRWVNKWWSQQQSLRWSWNEKKSPGPNCPSVAASSSRLHSPLAGPLLLPIRSVDGRKHPMVSPITTQGPKCEQVQVQL